ncbi:LysR family transcriptional regulator [Lampropedia puyangensis]|uniref:LysR family transcriptional regulator n=1 Tax=Lampropedia puyangensis TaxID=1330072 RepID=A0A4V4GSS6_9BURK|nr:LysR substrate-binding domain-containing protein [Lampropedia puyangensis]THU05486.1 LysR family transcriptional regulator [Lampropedia puyangensis]
MELRQLRYFVRVVELGSMSAAALDLGLAQSAVSQQLSRLESELSTRLLLRRTQGVIPTEAGMAFFREAQLTLRHAQQAIHNAQQARLSGTVSVGLPTTTATILAVPLIRAMRERYPDVRLLLTDGMSGHLAHMLQARSLDVAILFDTHTHAAHTQEPALRQRWQTQGLLDEDLFLFRRKTVASSALPAQVTLNAIKDEPLILPTANHGLRSTLQAAFNRQSIQPYISMEIDSLHVVMAAVADGLGSTIQPWAALGRVAEPAQHFEWSRIDDNLAVRSNILCCLSDEELSPAALALRVVLLHCVRELVRSGRWFGAHLHPGKP